MTVGSNIRFYREQKGYTQEELAKKVDVVRSTVTQWENGWSSPRMGMVEKLAGVLGISPSDIVSDGRCLASPRGMSVSATEDATVPLRLIGRVHAGSFEDEECIDSSIEVPMNVYNRHPRCIRFERRR